jgi:carbon monoxide dehydrogenase subunit G
MARAQVSMEISFTPDEAWELASDLSKYEQWLTLHEGWRSELPAEIAEGAKVTSVVSVKGFRNRVDWTLTEYNPPRSIKLVGNGKGGVKVGLDLTIESAKKGSLVSMDVEVSGGMVVGPVGLGVARALKGDIKKSLENLAKLK